MMTLHTRQADGDGVALVLTELHDTVHTITMGPAAARMIGLQLIARADVAEIVQPPAEQIPSL